MVSLLMQLRSSIRERLRRLWARQAEDCDVGVRATGNLGLLRWPVTALALVTDLHSHQALVSPVKKAAWGRCDLGQLCCFFICPVCEHALGYLK